MLAEEKGRYRPVEVRTGREFEDKTEVLEGLEAGQTGRGVRSVPPRFRG
jgi:membrane fusion protein, copper/silver efflux system